MVNSTEIVKKLTGLVGFATEEVCSTSQGAIPDSLKQSRSGLTFQEGHPLVTISNLRDCAPADMNDIQFAAWLQRKVESSIKKVFTEISTRKRLERSFHAFLQDVFVYNGSGSIYAQETKMGRFLGYQFVLKKQEGVVIKINRIGLQSTSPQTQGFNLYLYHTSNMAEPVQVIPAAFGTANKMGWLEPTQEVLLKFSDDEIDAGGAWFLGYYENDLAGQALNKEAFNFTSGGCNCGGREMENWKSWFNVVSIQPFFVYPEHLPGDLSLWDLTKMNYINLGKTWGLNFNISAYCDLTDVVARNERAFSKAILLQFTVDALQEIGYNIRTNRIAEKTMQKAIYELDDRGNGGSAGLKTQLDKELSAVTLDFSGLNRICMPCSETRVRYESI